MMNNKTILITGGAGYIGTACTKALLDLGYKVVVFDNLANSTGDMVDSRAVFVKGDVCNVDELEQVFSTYAIDSVFHLAALKVLPEGEQDPERYYKNNVIGMLNVLQVMSAHNVTSLFFSSTAAVYELRDDGIYNETHALRAQTVYGSTKLICEELIQQYERLGLLKQVVIFRYFNLAGDSGLRYVDPAPQNVFPLLARAACGKQSFAMFGNDYDTRDGTGIRDYIHINDLVHAHVLALEKQASGVFNLGTSEGTTVQELVTLFDEISGTPMKVSVEPRRAGDVARALADAHKAQAELGWKAQETLQSMVESTLATYSQ